MADKTQEVSLMTGPQRNEQLEHRIFEVLCEERGLPVSDDVWLACHREAQAVAALFEPVYGRPVGKLYRLKEDGGEVDG